MSAGGTGGVGGRREKTAALADECGSRCGARAATLTDEELEGGTGGTGSLSAHTGGPISSHSRASLCTRFAICLAQKSTPRRSRNPSRRRVLGSASSYAAHRESRTVVDQLALPNRVAPRPDRCGLLWNRRIPADWCSLWPRQDRLARGSRRSHIGTSVWASIGAARAGHGAAGTGVLCVPEVPDT